MTLDKMSIEMSLDSESSVNSGIFSHMTMHGHMAFYRQLSKPLFHNECLAGAC
jgi:hypothetical protein